MFACSYVRIEAQPKCQLFGVIVGTTAQARKFGNCTSNLRRVTGFGDFVQLFVSRWGKDVFRVEVL